MDRGAYLEVTQWRTYKKKEALPWEKERHSWLD